MCIVICPVCGLSPHPFMRLERVMAAALNGWYAVMIWIVHA